MNVFNNLLYLWVMLVLIFYFLIGEVFFGIKEKLICEFWIIYFFVKIFIVDILLFNLILVVFFVL